MEEASDGSFLLSAKNRHRLEAYAPLAFRTVERSPRAIPGAIAVRYSNTPILQHSVTPLSILASASFAGNVLYPFLQHLQVLR